MSYCEFINKVQSYQQRVETLYQDGYKLFDPNTFNINTYISFFDKLYIKVGFRIDALYYDSTMSGKSYLCGLSEKQNFSKIHEYISKDKIQIAVIKKEAFRSKYEGEYEDIFGPTIYFHDFIEKTRLKRFVIPEDSDFGFLQYLFLSEMGEQFALFWHALYNKKYIVCSVDLVEELVKDNNKESIFKTSDDELQRFKQTSLIPEINQEPDFYQITWYEYRNLKGVFKCTYRINRMKPFDIKLISTERALKILSSIIAY